MLPLRTSPLAEPRVGVIILFLGGASLAWTLTCRHTGAGRYLLPRRDKKTTPALRATPPPEGNLVCTENKQNSPSLGPPRKKIFNFVGPVSWWHEVPG